MSSQDENKYNELKRWDDYDFLRFCRGRKFVLMDVIKMF